MLMVIMLLMVVAVGSAWLLYRWDDFLQDPDSGSTPEDLGTTKAPKASKASTASTAMMSPLQRAMLAEACGYDTTSPTNEEDPWSSHPAGSAPESGPA